MKTLSLASWNIEHFRGKKKRTEKVLSFLKDQNPDIFSLYEIEGNPKEAIDLAKKTFAEAIADVEEIEEEHYKDSTVIFSLLRDNLTLWMSDD